MAGRIDKRVALVTGAAQGIGEAVARLFKREGATVVLSDIRASLGSPIGKLVAYLSGFICGRQ